MLQDAAGRRIPETTFRSRANGQWKDLTTREVFAGKTVIVFGLPGAYTPTCSTTHLPRYNELAPLFRRLGVDTVARVSVNDGFVMEAWQKDQDAPHVTFLPDGNAQFTAGLGMLVDKSDLGFGRRSWRYSMLVKDGVVQKMFIEPNKPGDPFEVSDADTMFDYVAPKAKKPDQVAILTREGCGFCARAKKLLKDLGYDYAEVSLGNANRSRVVGAITGKGTVPQVFVNGERIGGLEELERWAKKAA